ncbi:MAG: hypothetical protein DCC65_08085 [Planctomycetota bacterium]|nr:MAG: hypothetical protein DCC65_08085 [Planctomycetota bacterium]
MKKLRNNLASFACAVCLQAAAWGSLVNVSEMPGAGPADVSAVARETTVRAPNRTAMGLWAALGSASGASAAGSASTEIAAGRRVDNRSRLWIVFDMWGESPVRGRFQFLSPGRGRGSVTYGAQELASVRRTGVDLAPAGPPPLSPQSLSSSSGPGELSDSTIPLGG